MEIEEDRPRGGQPMAPRNLEPLGVAELRLYIDGLRGEIARAEAEIARKDAHRAASAAFFKT